MIYIILIVHIYHLDLCVLNVSVQVCQCLSTNVSLYLACCVYVLVCVQLRGMAVVAGMVQLSVGVTGLAGFALGHCGPLVLAPLLCILGFSIYRETALFCSDHWGMAAL